MSSAPVTPSPQSAESTGAGAIFLVFLRLGLTAFGGPVAHLGYFRAEFVARRRWLSEAAYADLVALCQFLPGPASSQVGIALGLLRGGWRGALAAWLGFTLPSALLLCLFGLGVAQGAQDIPAGLLHGLKLVAVAVVAQAVWGMARNLCNDLPRVSLMLLAAGAALTWPTTGGQIAVIAAAALTGWLLFNAAPQPAQEPLAGLPSARMGLLLLVLFFALLLGLPLLLQLWQVQWLASLNAFYRAGALVFGGGHVVLPLLQAAVVPQWVSESRFLAGYGATQAVPGPLFTFAAYLGAVMEPAPHGILGAALCLAAIFLPSFLLVPGTLPFWEQLRSHQRVRAALVGVNASVVGLLLAALYRPVWTHAVAAWQDVVVVLLALAALMLWRRPPWQVVLACGLLGWLLG